MCCIIILLHFSMLLIFAPTQTTFTWYSNCTLCSLFSALHIRIWFVFILLSSVAGQFVRCFEDEYQNHSLFAFFEFQKNVFPRKEKADDDTWSPSSTARTNRCVSNQCLLAAILRDMTSAEAAEHSEIFFWQPETQKNPTLTRVPGWTPKNATLFH